MNGDQPPHVGMHNAPVPDVDLGLDPLVHGRGRVPGQRNADFDLAAFADALERQDVADQVIRYAPGAVVRLDGPHWPSGTRRLHGRSAIRSWLQSSHELDVRVTHLVDGGDRVAFTESWRRLDGIEILAASTAEIAAGLIVAQQTILARTSSDTDSADGWTRLSRDLWTRIN